MVSAIKWMNDKYFLSRNPFPQSGIFADGSGEPSENGSAFQARVNADEFQDYVQKFVVTPSLSKGSGIGALWSVGTGAPVSEARGYGKSVLGYYVSREICKDFGVSLLAEQGVNAGKKGIKLLGAYGSFKKQVDTGFNAIAFRYVEWLAKPQPNLYGSPLIRMRDTIVDSLPEQVNDANRLEEFKRAVRTFRATDPRFMGTTLGPMDETLLNAIGTGNAASVLEYLHRLTPQAIWRNGFTYLDTALTVAMRAGVTKAILFVDQVEDFASPDVPRSKRLKEIERFRDVFKETCPFNSTTFFILTFHPRALITISDLWRDARLPGVDPPELGGARENQVRVKILREVKSSEDAETLISAYLEHPEYRLSGSPSPLHPFGKEAVEALRVVNAGRPGYMLSHARDLLDLAAEENLELISEEFVQGSESKLPAEERALLKKSESPTPSYLE